MIIKKALYAYRSNNAYYYKKRNTIIVPVAVSKTREYKIFIFITVNNVRAYSESIHYTTIYKCYYIKLPGIEKFE